MSEIIEQVTTISSDVNSLADIMSQQMTALNELDQASSEVASGVVNTKSISEIVAANGTQLRQQVDTVRQLTSQLEQVVSKSERS